MLSTTILTIEQSVEIGAHEYASPVLQATNQGLKQQNFANQASNYIEANSRVKSIVLMAL